MVSYLRVHGAAKDQSHWKSISNVEKVDTTWAMADGTSSSTLDCNSSCLWGLVLHYSGGPNWLVNVFLGLAMLFLLIWSPGATSAQAEP